MSSSLPWSTSAPPPAPSDPNEALRQIAANTAVTAQWVKYLVFLMVILILVNVLLFY
jgi:hypothetical protein